MTTDAKYYFTGIQFVVDENDSSKLVQIAMPVVVYDTVDAYLTKYHTEFAYALNAEAVKGLVVIVFDNNGQIVKNESWFESVPVD